MVAEWFGRAMTVPKYPEEEAECNAYKIEDLRAHISAGNPIRRNEGSRFAFQEHGDETWLFVDGQRYSCRETQTDLVRILCAGLIIDPEAFSQTQDNLQLLVHLLNRGSLYFPD
jgi:50S ribosomal protein L16 3-hydroxylase